MRYTVVRDKDTTDVKRLESDGETIWEYNGGGFSPEDDEFQEAILEDANFGQPQKDALRALLGVFDTDYE